MTIVKVLVDKVKHLDQIVVHRTTRESSKLVQVNVWGNIGPYPLDQEPLKAFAEEGGEAKVTEVIFSLRDGDFVDG